MPPILFKSILKTKKNISKSITIKVAFPDMHFHFLENIPAFPDITAVFLLVPRMTPFDTA